MNRKSALAKSEVVSKELPVACVAEPEAVEFFEAKRWGDTPCCPHCGSVAVYKMTSRAGQRNARFLWRCRDCAKQYTVRIGTVFEESLIPLHKWARVLWEASSSKNGVSALEISRKIEVTHRTAMFMLNRLRFAMGGGSGPEPLKGIVECDETYIGGKPRPRNNRQSGPRETAKEKVPVMTIVARGGEARLSTVADVSGRTITAMVRKNVDRSAFLMTDSASAYRNVGKEYAGHKMVRHSDGEYVRKGWGMLIHSNTAECVFSRVKRSIVGTYHCVSAAHLHRYLAHTEWLYNAREQSDGERVVSLIGRTVGKRLKVTDVVQSKAG